MKKIALKMIKFYQRTFSFDHGWFSFLFPHGFCRFRPTCSEYTYKAIEKYGTMKGTLCGFWRINRCNPFSRGGWDDVPAQKKEINRLASFGAVALLIYILVFWALLQLSLYLVYYKR